MKYMKINIFKHMHRYSEQCVGTEDYFVWTGLFLSCVFSLWKDMFSLQKVRWVLAYEDDVVGRWTWSKKGKFYTKSLKDASLKTMLLLFVDWWSDLGNAKSDLLRCFWTHAVQVKKAIK